MLKTKTKKKIPKKKQQPLVCFYLFSNNWWMMGVSNEQGEKARRKKTGIFVKQLLFSWRRHIKTHLFYWIQGKKYSHKHIHRKRIRNRQRQTQTQRQRLLNKNNNNNNKKRQLFSIVFSHHHTIRSMHSTLFLQSYEKGLAE